MSAAWGAARAEGKRCEHVVGSVLEEPERNGLIGAAGGDAELLLRGVGDEGGSAAAVFLFEDDFVVHGALDAEVFIDDMLNIAVLLEDEKALHLGGGNVGDLEGVVDVFLFLVGAELLEGVPVAGKDVVEADVALGLVVAKLHDAAGSFAVHGTGLQTFQDGVRGEPRNQGAADD